jgi:hypothetical protein
MTSFSLLTSGRSKTIAAARLDGHGTARCRCKSIFDGLVGFRTTSDESYQVRRAPAWASAVRLLLVASAEGTFVSDPMVLWLWARAALHTKLSHEARSPGQTGSGSMDKVELKSKVHHGPYA